MFPVHFVYLNPDQERDAEFDALCHCVPRVGDHVYPDRKLDQREFIVVAEVSYRFSPAPPGEPRRQVITVLLRDGAVSELAGIHPPS